MKHQRRDEHQGGQLRGKYSVDSDDSESDAWSSSDSSDAWSEEARPKKRSRRSSKVSSEDDEEKDGPVIRPLKMDSSVTMSCVGGLDQQLQSLREMIQMPLENPEIFQRFDVRPPGGVLLAGPPGTGKTLIVRAMAGSCKAVLFVVNATDCQSKWVGETEKFLRRLFEEAKRRQPSIIFFDEIDSLAPVRTSALEQHNVSVVSTLLTLMDGIHGRGQVVLIGATNRPDSVDPALRRPGRFDRELEFRLPDEAGRREIFRIHTKSWTPPLPKSVVEAVAKKAAGYCGADIKATCTEAFLIALKRCFPEACSSASGQRIPAGEVAVRQADFEAAMQRAGPSAGRSTSHPGAPLPRCLDPLLQSVLKASLRGLRVQFPLGQPSRLASAVEEVSHRGTGDACQSPSLLICGDEGCGQEQLSLAVLHAFEGCSVVVVDLAGVSLGGGSSVPQALEAKMAAARRAAPSILYLPSLHRWWSDEDLKDHGPALLDALKGLRTPNVLVLASAAGDVPTPFQEALVPAASIWKGKRQLPASDLERSVALTGLCRLPSPSPERIRLFVHEMLQGVKADLTKMLPLGSSVPAQPSSVPAQGSFLPSFSSSGDETPPKGLKRLPIVISRRPRTREHAIHEAIRIVPAAELELLRETCDWSVDALSSLHRNARNALGRFAVHLDPAAFRRDLSLQVPSSFSLIDVRREVP